MRTACAAMGHAPSALQSAPELAASIDRLAVHEVRLVAGLDVAGLRAGLGALPNLARPVIALDLAAGTVDGLRQSAIAQVRRAVDGLWPFAWDGEDFSATRSDALTLAHLPVRLEALARRVPGLSQSWARAVVEARLRGRSARVPAHPDLEWEQLCLMLSPRGLVVVTGLRSTRVPEAFVSAIEWLAARAQVAVAVLADALPPLSRPWARLLHGAWTLEAASPETEAWNEPPDAPFLLGVPEVEGRAHPLSAVELRLFEQVSADAELQPLFGFNVTVDDAPLLHAKVDLLWRVGRVAVEVDGAEHRAAARYRADRDRDHRLMCAGYRVLRLTNEEVVEDCGRAVEKIRAVVHLVKGGVRE